MGNREKGIINKQTRIRGGRADNYLFFLGATDWPEKVGGCDGRVSRSCTGVAGLFSPWTLWSYFLAVYLQGSETAGGGNVLALTCTWGGKTTSPGALCFH